MKVCLQQLKERVKKIRVSLEEVVERTHYSSSLLSGTLKASIWPLVLSTVPSTQCARLAYK